MPEGPEVTFLVNKIFNKFINKKLHSIKIMNGRYKNHGPPKNYNKFINNLPLKCLNVIKKGKVIFIYFENDWCIISKLGMTGWWFIDDKFPLWRNNKLKTFIFDFNSHELNFSDFRNFGTFIFTSNSEIIEKEYNRIAYDILDPTINLSTIKNNIINYTNKHPTHTLENVIIDQHAIISGIGNYLKAEILYDAKISPLRKLNHISLNEWKQIIKSAKKITKKMVKILVHGSTDDYINQMKIYRMEFDSFGNKIKVHKTINNRSTFYVPAIQK